MTPRLNSTTDGDQPIKDYGSQDNEAASRDASLYPLYDWHGRRHSPCSCMYVSNIHTCMYVYNILTWVSLNMSKFTSEICVSIGLEMNVFKTSTYHAALLAFSHTHTYTSFLGLICAHALVHAYVCIHVYIYMYVYIDM